MDVSKAVAKRISTRGFLPDALPLDEDNNNILDHLEP